MNEPLRIAGIDVSRGKVTVCILDRLPDQRLKDFIKKCEIYEFRSIEIDKLLALDFDAAVLEPTGGHYSRFWADKIKQASREVRWVGHREVHGYRNSWRLPDKTDKTDSVALACYGLERWKMPDMFLGEKEQIAIELRELYLRTRFLNKSVVPHINRLRQQLHWECPELAEHTVNRSWLRSPSGMWKAIAGDPSPKWAAIIENTIGSGISDFSRSLASIIYSQQQLTQSIERDLEMILISPELKPYLEAFEPLHFGRRAEVAILGAIYPFEQFKEKHNPLGAFKLACGMAQIWVESGDYTGWTPGGSVDIRKALWLWAYAVIPRKKAGNGFVSTPELERLREYYYNGSDQVIVKDGVEHLEHFDPGKGSQRLMRVARRAITILYRRLRDKQI